MMADLPTARATTQTGPVQPWRLSHRADLRALPLADRHYTRQKIGAPQFVPPGRCLVLLTDDADALWVTSWPLAAYVRHAYTSLRARGAASSATSDATTGGEASHPPADATARTYWQTGASS